MPRRNLTALLLLLVAVGLQATACGYSAPAEGEGDEPAKVEPVEDSDLSKVVLTEDAAKRIGLETAPVAVSNVESDVVVRGRVAADPAASGSLLGPRVDAGGGACKGGCVEGGPRARRVRERRCGRSAGG